MFFNNFICFISNDKMLFEWISCFSSVSLEDTRLITCAFQTFHASYFWRLFLISFKHDLVPPRYFYHHTFMFNMIVTIKIIHTNRIVTIFSFFFKNSSLIDFLCCLLIIFPFFPCAFLVFFITFHLYNSIQLCLF